MTPVASGKGMAIDVAGEALHLLPDGAVWSASTQALWLSDLHLGKAAQFRKHGVPIGSEPTLATLHRLRERIIELQPRSIWLLGDLFHSDINREWEPIAGLCEEISELDWVLVQGNHDMIPEVLMRGRSPLPMIRPTCSRNSGTMSVAMCIPASGWRGPGDSAFGGGAFTWGSDRPSCRRMAPSRECMPSHRPRVTGCTPSQVRKSFRCENQSHSSP